MVDSQKKFVEHFGGKLDRLIADCFKNIPLTFDEAFEIVRDARESICNASGNFLYLPKGIKSEWNVMIAETELGLIFSSPSNSQCYIMVTGKYHWPLIKTSDIKWQTFIQRSPF